MQTLPRFLPVFMLALALFAGCATQPPAPPLALATQTAAPPIQRTATATLVSPATAVAPTTPAASPMPIPEPATPQPSPTWSPEALAPALPGTNQGFELVGHTALGEVGWHAGLALSGHCAYVGNRRSDRVAIVDVSNPAALAQIGFLPIGPGGQPVELRVLPERALLVVADFGHGRLLTFDVTDCATPAPLAVLELPGAPHEFYLWSDGERVLVFGAMFDHGPPDLIVVDMTEPAQPAVVAEWSLAAEGSEGLLHSLSLSSDGRQAFLALWNGGVLVAEVDLPQLRALRDGEGALRPVPFVAAHSVVPLDEPGYLLVANELWSCPFGETTVVSIADPARPFVVARAALPENRCEALPEEDAVYSAHNPLVVGHLVFASWYSAGLQVFDTSDPMQPERVAQFVPAGEGAAPQSHVGSHPVQTWSYPILRDGLFYVVDIQSGLYLLRYHGPGAEAVVAAGHVEANVTVRR